MSRTGQYLARVAGPGDGAVRRRLDVRRAFLSHPDRPMTVNEVSEYTRGTVRQVRELLDELVLAGWLKCGKDRSHKTTYWRGQERRGA